MKTRSMPSASATQAGVLAAGAAEALQRVAGDVVAARDRDLLDRVGHAADGDVEEAVGDRLRAIALPVARRDLGGERGEARARRRRASSGSSPSRPEHARKERRLDLAEQHVGSRSPSAARRGDSTPARDSRRRSPGRRESARRRSARIEPPPAATVWMPSSARARARRRPGSRTRARTRRRSALTSVDVPPMSKPIDRCVDAARAELAVRTMPTMPPAGPGQDRVLALERVRVGEAARRLHEVAAATPGISARDLRRRSGAGSARGRRRRPSCRRGRRASSAG